MGYNIEPSVSLPQICAPREDLVRFFDQCSKKQCIYIQAPAGYGKTISALLWLKKSGCRSAWFTLDKYDNSLTLFYRSFCQSLLAAFPQSDAVDALASSPLFSLSPVESTMEFLTMFSWRKGKNALVVDDLHIITNEEILKSLPYVLRRLPGTVNVLLISRTALPQTMDSLNDDEKMAFISAKELSFTPEEIHSYFIICGKAISQKEAFDLYANTDGWVIILNAMLMQKNREFSETEFKSSFTEFFKKNIWNGFDENTQVFLMKTSVVDSFTLKLCQMLTERTDSGEVLGKLLRGNVNMSRLGEEFRYHNLFLEFLRGQL
ncbi:MAG: hypothetical protein FWF26_05470, partial [Treponema sp.]|nr:hypothetical protein [Treponema sp.]